MLTQIWLQRGPGAVVLWPLSYLMGLLVKLRRWFYQVGLFKTQRVAVPVIVVGNVITGGGGKTPTVIALVEHLRLQGWKPGVISRGYGRRTTDCREVQADSLAQDVGDEALLIKRRTGVPLFVARQRIDAARALLLQHEGVDVLLSDDGLQHHALHRDLEIVVFDARGLGNGWLLPAGPLREPWPRQSPVPMLVLNTAQPARMSGYCATRQLSGEAHNARGQRMPLRHLQQQRCMAVAGIAQPQAFFDMLQAQGIALTHTVALPDHEAYAHGAPAVPPDTLLLCTEKDAVKLWQHEPDAWAVGLELQLDPAFCAAVNQQFSRPLK